MKEKDISQVTQFIDQGILITAEAKAAHEASLQGAKPTTKVRKTFFVSTTTSLQGTQPTPC